MQTNLIDINLLALPFKLRDDLSIDMRNSMNAFSPAQFRAQFPALADSSEERRVGSACSSRWSPYR